MAAAGKSCLSLIAGCVFMMTGFTGAAFAAAPVDYDALIAQADKIKSSDNATFTTALKGLDAASASLSPSQRDFVRYLHAWQTAYSGDYDTALPQLNDIFEHSSDISLKVRAGVTSVNSLSIVAHYQEAYSRLSQLLELVPKTSNNDARMLAYAVASFLYERAGQYELAVNYADKSLAESSDAKASCKAMQIKLNALYRMGSLSELHEELPQDIQICVDANEPIWAALMRADIASMTIAQGRPAEAIRLLQSTYEDVVKTRYPPAVSSIDSALAVAYWKTGNADSANAYAHRAISDGVKHEITEALVDAYRVLYEVAKSSGDTAAALSWHEKYAVADKGYLNDASTRALAYQMVKQQVQEKKQQIEALNKKNQVLQLQQTLSAKNVVAGRLWIALLMTVLASIVLYAYRTKRSQLKFMNLARRDGLTGIFNRQHFIWEAERALEYAAKSVRDACVIVIDLDHFKQINDEHGHAAGDTVLKRTVAACQEQLRTLDVFGRLGGEEFGIFMPDCVPERAVDVAEAMRKTIAGLCDLEENAIAFPVYASFGISSARWSGYNLRQLLAHADSALYQAKREGRNRVAICDESTPVPAGLPPGVLDRRRG